MKVYFWTKMSRVTGGANVPNSWHAWLNTDAKATGLFDDSVTQVYSVTARLGQTVESVTHEFQRWFERHRQACGYSGVLVVVISRREYDSWNRELTKENKWVEA
jgi:hypothetical protein